MDGALVGAGSLWLYKHTIAIYGYIPLNWYCQRTMPDVASSALDSSQEKFEFPLCRHDMACLITGKKQCSWHSYLNGRTW
jgi:hypothetical protein